MPIAVEDQLAIQQLYARYNHAIDSGNGAGWAATFAADGVFTSASGTFTGTQQLAEFATGFGSRLKARHWTGNYQRTIELVGCCTQRGDKEQVLGHE